MPVYDLHRPKPSGLLSMVRHRQWPQLAQALDNGAPAHAIVGDSLNLFEEFLSSLSLPLSSGETIEQQLTVFDAFLRSWRGNDPDRPTPLTIATILGRRDLVERLLAAGHDPCEAGEGHNPVTAIACHHRPGDFKIARARQLPETGWNDSKNTARQSCLRLLRSHGLSFDLPAWRGACALLLACLAKDTPTILFLLEEGANPEGSSLPGANAIYRLSPLEAAIITHNENAVRALIQAGANPLRTSSLETWRDSTLVEVAGDMGQPGMLQTFSDYLPACVAAPLLIKAWRIAMLVGNGEVADWGLRKGYSPDEVDEHGRTSAHLASISGNEVILLRLLSLGVDMDAFDQQGATPWSLLQFNHPLLFSRFRSAPVSGDNVLAFPRRS